MVTRCHRAPKDLGFLRDIMSTDQRLVVMKRYCIEYDELLHEVLGSVDVHSRNEWHGHDTLARLISIGRNITN